VSIASKRVAPGYTIGQLGSQLGDAAALLVARLADPLLGLRRHLPGLAGDALLYRAELLVGR
jgi:hypothetical protein